MENQCVGNCHLRNTDHGIYMEWPNPREYVLRLSEIQIMEFIWNGLIQGNMRYVLALRNG